MPGSGGTVIPDLIDGYCHGADAGCLATAGYGRPSAPAPAPAVKAFPRCEGLPPL